MSPVQKIIPRISRTENVCGFCMTNQNVLSEHVGGNHCSLNVPTENQEPNFPPTWREFLSDQPNIYRVNQPQNKTNQTEQMTGLISIATTASGSHCATWILNILPDNAPVNLVIVNPSAFDAP